MSTHERQIAELREKAKSLQAEAHRRLKEASALEHESLITLLRGTRWLWNSDLYRPLSYAEGDNTPLCEAVNSLVWPSGRIALCVGGVSFAIAGSEGDIYILFEEKDEPQIPGDTPYTIQGRIIAKLAKATGISISVSDKISQDIHHLERDLMKLRKKDREMREALAKMVLSQEGV